jgi:phosphatidylglycerophosphate synthase
MKNDKTFGKTPPAKSYYILGKCARFMSLRLIPTIAKTRIQPLHLSVASLACSFIAAVFYTFATPVMNKIALIFFLLFFILDHVDGDLARYKGEVSFRGEVLDHIVGKISLMLIYSGILCGLSWSYNPVFVWSMGFLLISGFFGFQSLTVKRSLMVEKNNMHDHKFDKKDQFTGHDGLLRILFKELTSAYVMAFHLIILGSLFDLLLWTLVFSVLHVWFYYICQIYTSLKYFHSTDQLNK